MTTPDFSSQETGFAAGVLQALGVSASSSAYGTDVNLLSAQQQQEGQWGAIGSYNAAVNNNPFNLQSVPQSSKAKSSGVQSDASLIFSTAQTGELATANFIQVNDPAVAAALKSSTPTAAQSGFFSNIGGWISHKTDSTDVAAEQAYASAVQKAYGGDLPSTSIYPVSPYPTSPAGNALAKSNAAQTQGTFLDSLGLIMTPQMVDSKGIVTDLFGTTVGDITNPVNIWNIAVSGMVRGAITLIGLALVGIGLVLIIRPLVADELPGVGKLVGALAA